MMAKDLQLISSELSEGDVSDEPFLLPVLAPLEAGILGKA